MHGCGYGEPARAVQAPLSLKQRARLPIIGARCLYRDLDYPENQPVAAARFASRLRPTSAAAAAPNKSTIGGAGTGAGSPPVEPVAPLLVLLLVLELVAPLLVLVLVLLLVLKPPVLVLVLKLPLEDAEEVTSPLDDAEDETSPLDDAEDDTLPLDEDEDDTLPLDEDDTSPLLPPLAEEILPLELLDDPPLADVLLTPPVELEVDPPLVLLDPPLVLEVDDTTTLPPPLPPPPKNPPAKNPPPNPPNPPLPPMTKGPPPSPPVMGKEPLDESSAGGSGTGWLATVTTVGAQAVCVLVTTLRTRATRRAAPLLAVWRTTWRLCLAT
ncbi:MAG: hypothetical protein WC803_03445 [Sphingomonas sp.]|jgi:hypothetical protein